MDPITAAVLIKSLDGLALRAAATSQNIANARTPGYRPVRVTFEAELARAARSGEVEVAAVAPRVEGDPSAAVDPEVRLDLAMVDAASTAGRYGALIELLNRQAQITGLAISGGR